MTKKADNIIITRKAAFKATKTYLLELSILVKRSFNLILNFKMSAKVLTALITSCFDFFASVIDLFTKMDNSSRYVFVALNAAFLVIMILSAFFVIYYIDRFEIVKEVIPYFITLVNAVSIFVNIIDAAKLSDSDAIYSISIFIFIFGGAISIGLYNLAKKDETRLNNDEPANFVELGNVVFVEPKKRKNNEDETKGTEGLSKKLKRVPLKDDDSKKGRN